MYLCTEIVKFMWNLLLIGWVTITSSVIGAQVMVDEQDGIPMRGQQICLQMEAGRHLIMVDKEGYTPYIDTIHVPANDNLPLAVWMEPESKRAMRATTSYKHLTWAYQTENKIYSLRWVGLGGSIGSGLNVHVSLFDMRFGLFSIEPCLWGMNVPFISGASHVKTAWQVHPKDRRSEELAYEVAIPTQDIQFYYTPMVGVHLPVSNHSAFVLSAGPQISWTHINWSEQLRDLPISYDYIYTTGEFPHSGFYFDPVWFSAQAGLLFTGQQSDLLTYFKYQDGYFLGVEIRF